MRLIITNSLPTSQIFGEKIDVSWYLAQGVIVEFWDLSPLFLSKEKLESFYSGALNYRYQSSMHRIFESVDALMAALDENTTTPHVFWHLSRFSRMHNDDLIIELFNRFKACYVFQHFDPHSVLPTLASCFKWPIRELRQFWYARNCNPSAVVTSGILGRRQALRRYPRASVISVPSIKVLWSDPGDMLLSTGIVFVDESIAFDPDSKLHGKTLCTDISGYYRRMRDFFSLVEDTLGEPVRIACSGKFHYHDPESYFGVREVLYGKTLPLLQTCKLAIGHLSLALDQAIISRKPVLLVDDPDFTPWRRVGFRDVITRFKQYPKYNNRVTAADLYMNLNRDLSFYSNIENIYFRESGVHGDYREICLSAFQQLACA